MTRLRLPDDFHYCDEWGEHDRTPFMEDGLKVYEIQGCGCDCCRVLRAQFDSHRHMVLADRAHRYAKRRDEFSSSLDLADIHPQYIRMSNAEKELQKTFEDYMPANIVWEN